MSDDPGFPNFKRQIALLSCCWALVSTSMMLIVSVTALTGNMLAEDKALATLPVALQWLATAMVTVPASFLMAKIGRRNGFWIAAGLLICGAGLGILSIYAGSFLIYCVASSLVGAASGFSWYYRFAAAEVVPESYKSRAISYVLAGGIVAAIAGPTLARTAHDLLSPHTFAGAFLIIALLQLVVIVMLAMVRIPKPDALQLEGGRPLRQIAAQPKFMVAVLGGVVAYAVMVLLMSVTPLAMEKANLSFDYATHVIQWHILGMYIPAFFSGHLIRRFGTLPIMFTGGLIVAACIVIGIMGQNLWHFWVAMALLGLGWNFLYVGATTLLTETYTVAERAKAQAANEFLVFISVGAATFLSGSALHYFGWSVVNMGALPLVLIVLLAIGWLAIRERMRARTADV